MPFKLGSGSFSALSDTPARSYAPELGRPKGEYRVSYRISLPFSPLYLLSCKITFIYGVCVYIYVGHMPGTDVALRG